MSVILRSPPFGRRRISFLWELSQKRTALKKYSTRTLRPFTAGRKKTAFVQDDVGVE